VNLEKSEVIWMNGEFIPWDKAQVHVLTHALHYATSVFEGMRAYATPRGAAIVRLADHVRRLEHSCRLLYMPLEYSGVELGEAIRATVKKNHFKSCYIRPLVFRGYSALGVDPSRCPVEVVIATFAHGAHFGDEAREQGIDCCFSSWRRVAPDTLPVMAKASGNYTNSALAILEAKRHGYHDAILLDVDGYAAESHGANMFVVHGETLYTPPLGHSVLSGITRRCVLALANDTKLTVVEQRLAREMVVTADEVFLTGTAAEITPVRSLEQRPVGSGGRGPITKELQAQYLGIVRGELEDRHGWLTLV